MLPGWANPQTRQQIQAGLVEWGKKNGYPPDELHAVHEPRHVITMTKAMLFDRNNDRLKNGALAEPVVAPVQRGTPPPQVAAPAAGVAAAQRAFEGKATIASGAKLLQARRAERGAHT